MTRRAVGLDGCAGGWVAVTLDGGEVAEVEVVERAAEVLVGRHDAAGVDIPIGFVDAPAREADVAARRLLPGRGSSVFAAPPRAVVDAHARGELPDHAAATALAVGVTGKGMSRQAWALTDRIVEVDRLVADGTALLEVHPEVAFALLAGGPLPRKRSWAGLQTRRAILRRFGLDLPDRFVGDDRVAPDDVLDAAVVAWVADGAAAGEPLLSLPDMPTQHDRGRPIAIVARRPPGGATVPPRPSDR